MHGCKSFHELQRDGRAKSLTTIDVIEKMHDIILKDGRIEGRVILNTIGISDDRVGYI